MLLLLLYYFNLTPFISHIWPIFFSIMSNVMWPIHLTRRQAIEFNEDFRIHRWWWMNRSNMFDKLTESCFDKRVMPLPKTFILLSRPLNFEPATLEKKKAVRKVNYRLNTWKTAEKTISLLNSFFPVCRIVADVKLRMCPTRNYQ